VFLESGKVERSLRGGGVQLNKWSEESSSIPMPKEYILREEKKIFTKEKQEVQLQKAIFSDQEKE
jgi:hypothetical protein